MVCMVTSNYVNFSGHSDFVTHVLCCMHFCVSSSRNGMVTGLLPFIFYIRFVVAWRRFFGVNYCHGTLCVHIEHLAPCVCTAYVILAIAMLSGCSLKRVTMGPVHLFV